MRTPPTDRQTIPAQANATDSITSPSPTDDELALVNSTQSYLACRAIGDKPGADQVRAWDDFYRHHAPIVGQLARAGDKATATRADAEQDIWMALVMRLESFRVDATLGSFPGWLRTVARRRLLDRRRAGLRRPVPRTWDEPPTDLMGSEVDPAESYERAEERAVVNRLLERLRVEVTPLNYRVLHLRSIEERTPTEVAGLVGLSAEQVRVRHHRMLTRLRGLAAAQMR